MTLGFHSDFGADQTGFPQFKIPFLWSWPGSKGHLGKFEWKGREGEEKGKANDLGNCIGKINRDFHCVA